MTDTETYENRQKNNQSNLKHKYAHNSILKSYE